MIRFLQPLILLIFLTLINHASASNINDRISFGIQSSKTLSIRPFEPLERDMLSIYNAVYESLITIDDD